MTLEDLIYKRIAERTAITGMLARFGNAPAVFYQSAPGDKANGWKGKKQYPRLDFSADMKANPERQSSGLVSLNIWCSETAAPPEEIEPEVRNALCDVFMQPAGQPPYCLTWVRSDSFEMGSKATEDTQNVTGITVLFDVLAFPIQETTDPDPVLAMNNFIKEWEPAAVVIGADTIVDYFTAAASNPAFYFRLASLEVARETNSVVWMNASLAGHIFASAASRLQWIKYLADTLAVRGEITMLDTSPMFIKAIKADSAADHLTTGQLRISVQFGILRRPKYAHALMQANKEN